MRVLITGAAGFIGSHLAEALIEEGHEVWGVDDLSTGRVESVRMLEDIGTFAEMDIAQHDLWHKADVIYHCAGSYADPNDWERDVRTNVLGTINVIRAAQRAGSRIVYFQTSLCYGMNPGPYPITPGGPLAPVGSYAVSKTAGERYIADSGVDYVSLRLANIYGPRNLTGPVPAFYRRLVAGEDCTVSNASRDFLYIDDLIPVAVAAATKGSGVYHVAHGWDRPIIELWRAVATALDYHGPEPEVQARGKDDAATILLDSRHTMDTFDWRPSVPLADGIARAVDWYAANGVERTFTHLALKG